MEVKNNFFHPLSGRRSGFFKHTGVASIEYALIAAMIAVAIIGILQNTGSTNAEIWSDWTGKFITAINSVIGP